MIRAGDGERVRLFGGGRRTQQVAAVEVGETSLFRMPLKERNIIIEDLPTPPPRGDHSLPGAARPAPHVQLQGFG